MAVFGMAVLDVGIFLKLIERIGGKKFGAIRNEIDDIPANYGNKDSK